jgi:hypothetical protein
MESLWKDAEPYLELGEALLVGVDGVGQLSVACLRLLQVFFENGLKSSDVY